MDTTQKGVTSNDTKDLSIEDATNAILKQWEVTPKGADKPVEGEPKATEEKPVDASQPSGDEEIELDLEDEEKPADPEDSKKPTVIESDDALVKISVDGEEITASVKDLKRLYGQEASLTRKSQELAAKRKEAEEASQRHLAALEQMAKTAEDEYRPYAEIDFLVASKELSAEELNALRQEAQAKYQKYAFFNNELNGYVQNMAQQRAQFMAEMAKQTIAELSDPEKGIKGWGPELYAQIREHAVNNGMAPETFNNIVDVPSLKLLYNAYRYDKAKKVALQKKATAPKKVLTSTASADSTRFNEDKGKVAIEKLKKTGSKDDAVAAILARWEQQ